jgi:Helix-turn-helix domain
MGLHFETRVSDSPWVASVWTCLSQGVAEMTSVATETWGLVFWHQDGKAYAAVTGPESRTGTAPVPDGATFLGIQFAVGTSLRMTGTRALVDAGIALPDTTSRNFRLDGCRWETPRADDAEGLVDRLVRQEVVVRDPVVTAVLNGRGSPVTDRTVERRFRTSTGFSRGSIRQIGRARAAAERLLAGDGVGEVVSGLGYYDEPHLARALRRYVGRTASQLRDGTGGALALSVSAHDVVEDFDHPVGVGRGLPER